MMIIWGQLDFWGLMDMLFNYSLEKEKLKMKKKNKSRDGMYFLFIYYWAYPLFYRKLFLKNE
jgi:hypothetical protein